jgi:hypothetical protein
VPVIRVRFIFDAKGEVTGLESIQPGGVFDLKKLTDKATQPLEKQLPE